MSVRPNLEMWKNDVYTLLDTLNLHEELRCYNRAVVDSAEALCILLRRVAYPCRYGHRIELGRRVTLCRFL